MPYLWLLLLWLVCITIFFVDTWLTLLFIGHRTCPAVRQVRCRAAPGRPCSSPWRSGRRCP